MVIPMCLLGIAFCVFVLGLGLKESYHDSFGYPGRTKEDIDRDIEEEREKWFFDTRF